MKRQRLVIVVCTAIAVATLGGSRAAAADSLFEELVTVTEDGFGVAWETADAGPSVLYWGETAGDLQPFEDTGWPSSTHHLVVITGLASDTLYYYSTTPPGAAPTADNPFSPGQIRTLKTPPGAYLFSFATINDSHVGETVAGLIVIGNLSLTPGFKWPDPNNPYWLFTNTQAVAQINALGPEFVIHKGDVSSDSTQQQYEDAVAIFDQLSAPIHYVRGNHDVPKNGGDYFETVLGVPVTHYFFDHPPLRLIIMETNDAHGLSDPADDQIAWLKTAMDDARALGLRAMVFAHQTFARQGGIPWAVDESDALAATTLLAQYPHFVGMFAGHSHRAKVNHDEKTGWVPYVETPASKEYPLGFAFYRVYEGGYTQSFYREKCEDCLEWAAMTRGEYFGLAPWIMLGKTEDRNFTELYPDYVDDDSSPADDDSSPTDDDSSPPVDDDVSPGASGAAAKSGCGC